MRRYRGIAFLGIALGVAFGAGLNSSPVAAADPDPTPIEVWPQDFFALDGAADGSPTNVVNYLPDGWGTTEDQDFTSYFPGSGEYSAQLNLLDIPNTVTNTYQDVLTSTGGAPADGSYSDSFSTFYAPFLSISGDVPYFTNNYIDLQASGLVTRPLFPSSASTNWSATRPESRTWQRYWVSSTPCSTSLPQTSAQVRQRI